MTTIQIERLTTGTSIYLKQITWSKLSTRFDGFAAVDAIEFDGYGYALTLDTGDRHYVDASGFVDFGGTGEPILRAETEVSFEEWQAKAEAIGFDIDHGLVELSQLQGYQPRAIDERPLVTAVAEAIGVPALMAAE